MMLPALQKWQKTIAWAGEEEQSFRREMLIGKGPGLGKEFFGKDILNHVYTYNLQHILKPTVLMQRQRGLGNWSGTECYAEDIFMPNYTDT